MREQKIQRKITDLACLLFLALFYLILSGCIAYCVHYGDLYRIVNGYDNCGNVCGRDNIHEKYACNGVNMRNKTFLLVRGSSGITVVNSKVDRECVATCKVDPNYRKFLNRCIPKKIEEVVNTHFSKTGLKNFLQEVSEDFDLCWKEVWYLCLIALVISVLMLIFLRYLVGVLVWLVLIGICVVCLFATINLWLLWKCEKTIIGFIPKKYIPNDKSEKYSMYLVYAITATIITIIVLLVIVAMCKRIELVIQLFEESGNKALAAMPLLMLQPILTFIALATVLSLWIYFSVWIESAGFIQESRPKFIYYRKDFWMQSTRWYNLLGMFWMCQFIFGCQHMIIAGAVSKWYFTRNKNNLGTPICAGTYNLIRYHLGSVAVGSFIIPVEQFIRVLLTIVQRCLKNRENKCAEATTKSCHCCLCCLERILQYLSRNAYIIIAINGYTFCKAGKQAFLLLVSNALRVAAINSVGSFVLFLGKVMVVMCSVLIAMEMLQKKEGIQHIWVLVSLVGLFAYFASHCFVTVYEMTIETVFMCFCEDCEQNDGIRRPYYMSRSLMEFVENSEKATMIHDARVAGRKAWR